MFARWDRLYRTAAAILLTVCAATAQGLAPEVLLLSRIKRHLREELAHVPNYTCLETISRFRDDPKSPLQSRKGLAPMDTMDATRSYRRQGRTGARSQRELTKP